jgi:FecR protein
VFSSFPYRASKKLTIKNKPEFFTKFAPRVTALILALSLILAQGIASASASLLTKDAITRGEFILMLAQNQPESPLLPPNHAGLSKLALFTQVANSLKTQGINVLENKSASDLLSQQEFVRITYAFAGGPKEKSLIEQKLFLKSAGIIASTDIGLTTGIDGKVYQTHKDQSEKFQAELAGPIFMDDQFETEYTSKALFTFDDQSTLTMSEDTVININKHIFNPDKNIRETIINASLGWVRFKVTKKLANGSSFKVVTPTAIAGVRGTEFVVKVEPGGKTTFLVLEGQIETRPILPNGKEGKVAFISA